MTILFHFLLGHGEISVRGGAGSGNGGGGAGGRIGIHCRFRYSYGGKFTDRGGLGANNNLNLGAAAGTAYREENLRPLQYRELKYSQEKNETYFQVRMLVNFYISIFCISEKNYTNVIYNLD